MAWRSELAICNAATGETRSILHTERLIEAPNWTPDGLSLIVNGDGRLYRVALASPELVEIDTGFAKALNNDHGISPDGTTLVISDKTETGLSQIYTLPICGGTPQKVTEKAPSYWHGWSPDGQTLAYVGRRDGPFRVLTCPVSGGEETQLTSGFDHCDGPDYSIDGRYLWFNGEVDGQVDLWRIPATGGEPERMTADEYVNWFPHPSPKGGEVLYLAYQPGTEGHPRDQEVALKMLSEETGESRTILELFGGQGSINVPCWAPDGEWFAFVRYARP